MKQFTDSEKRARIEQHESDVKWFMNDVRGRRLLMKMLSSIGLYRCTYDPGLKDAASEMLFREGQKNVGYRILSEINTICPECYFQMMKENENA